MAKDLFNNTIKVKSPFDKERSRWTVDDYRSAMGDRSFPARNFTLDILIRFLVESPAFLSLSPRATKLFIACVNATWINSDVTTKRPGKRKANSEYDREKEDRPDLDAEPFYCPYAYAKVFGVGSDKQIAQAFRELKAFKFIEQVGVSRRNMPNIYRHISGYKALTWADCQALKLNKALK